LQRYYAKIIKEESALLQTHQEPTSTWTGQYKGQSAQGTDAIGMLQFILDGTKKEETLAHSEEASAQQKYETSMGELKAQQLEQEKAIARLQQLTAETEQTLLEKKADLKATEADKAAVDAYLLKIKLGCDFITVNIEERSSNRNAETKALNTATEQLKSTPVYTAAVGMEHNETLGDCLAKCAGVEEHLVCRACLAGVTEPAYCAGHKETLGC